MFDEPLAIATAPRRSSKQWKRRTITIAELVGWARNPADKKECGCYVMGSFREERRSLGTLRGRSAVTLDADTADADGDLWEAVKALPYVVLLHPTFSSTPDAPRYRIIIPLNRAVQAREYRRIAWKLTTDLGEDKFDIKASLSPAQFMYKPSTQDREHYDSHVLLPGEGKPLADADELLASAPRLTERTDAENGHAENISGIAGAVARAFSIEDVIREFDLPYTQSGPDRWSYTGASSENGLHDMGNGYAYSHHTTDPAHNGGRRVTVFDLVRIHKFGDEDEEKHKKQAEKKGEPWRLPSHDLAQTMFLQRPEVVREFVTGFAAEKDSGRLPDDPPPPFKVTDVSTTAARVRKQIGRPGRPLASIFLRGSDLVHLPRIGEAGYQPPKRDGSHDGPAQVQIVNSAVIRSRVDWKYSVFRVGDQDVPYPAPVPKEAVDLAIDDIEGLTEVRRLRGVTHTPVVRADGSILWEPGYDDASGLAYMPDDDLDVPPVPDDPSPEQVAEAGALVLEMVDGFPFVTPHDQANYIGALLTPLLRPLAPPPYKMLAVNAPQPASGKTKMARLLGILHGASSQRGIAGSDAEVQKVITSTLHTTTAPVVVFDNVSGVIRSPRLAALLTEAEGEDRKLGSTENVKLVNDRLWVVTGNNVEFGGDMPRRAAWVNIDADCSHPERRTFAINDLDGWVRERRGRLLSALLVMIRAWVAAGRPVGALETSDDYGHWAQTLNGILRHAFGDNERVGDFNSIENQKTAEDANGNEAMQFLAAVYEKKQDKVWPAKSLINDMYLDEDDLPSRDDGRPWTAKSIGHWLRSQRDRHEGEYVLRGVKDRKDVFLWHVEHRPDPGESAAGGAAGGAG